MSLFNKIAKSVEHAAKAVEKAAEIGKLDAIVSRRVQQFDREVDQKVQDLRRHLPQEEIERIEQEIIDSCLCAYDREAVPYMGREVNADWVNGGGNNLEVRKRMLNRELQSRRGKLAAAMATLRASVQVLLDRLVVTIRRTEQEILDLLPTDLSTIEQRIYRLRENLVTEVDPGFPGGLSQLDAFADGAVEAQLKTLRDHVIEENERLRAEAINEFRQESFNMLYNSLYVQIRQTTDTVKANLTADAMSDPDNKVITPEVVEKVRRDMDHAVSRFLADLRQMNQM